MLVLGVALLSGGSTAASDGASWFTGFSPGQSKFNDYELADQANSLDDTDTGYMVRGGYRFLAVFAASVGYVDLGSLRASSGIGDYVPPGEFDGPGVDGDPIFGFDDRIEVDGFAGWAHGILPVGGGKAQLFGSLGLFAWDQQVTYTDPVEDFRGSASGTDLAFGAGANVFLNKNLSLELTYTRFNDVGDRNVTGHQNDIDLISAGVVYHWGVN
ncbi:hypothetical protein ABI59_16695 [Acidobacteria bacterium Mor1]|nr:hypothetical protein ABI59_16695 [Acidobacteria bacterium Mor1]